MDDRTPDDRSRLRRSLYVLLMAVGAGIMLGRILAVDAVDKIGIQEYRLKNIPVDRVKKKVSLESQGISGEALQEELDRAEKIWREKAILRRPFLSANDRSRWCAVRAMVEEDMRVTGAPLAIDKVIQQQNWDTIDMVKHDGHLYSSKPPLLTLAMAAIYWPIHQCTGATLGTHPYEIGRSMLVLLNLVPLLIYFWLMARLIERLGTSDWGRIFAMAVAVFGTFLTTFVVTINNHLTAAVCAIVAVDAAVRIGFDGERRLRYFVMAGLFGALAAFNEFPAASLFAILALLLLWLAPRQTLWGFVPATLLVAVVFFGANWMAFGTLEPAYLHRTGPDSWYDYEFERDGKIVSSYWKNPVGLDRGEPSPALYAFHVLIGHHGIFSLTPVWILSVIGMGLWMRQASDVRLRWLAAGIAAMTVACIVFYLSQPTINRNYGGATSGLRWVFWLAPLWLLAMLPTVDRMAERRWMRGLGLTLLMLSALSAAYPTWNPWTHPWLWNFTHYLYSGS